MVKSAAQERKANGAGNSPKDVNSSGLGAFTVKTLMDHKAVFGKTAIIALIIFSFLYGMWKIPFVNFGVDRMSAIGAADYIFVLVISIFVGMLFTFGHFEKKSNAGVEGRALGFGSTAFAGVVSAACPVCQGIVIAALGSPLFAIPLGFLVPYLGFIKIASAALLGLAVFFKVDSLFTKKCVACGPVKSVTKKIKISKKLSPEPLLFSNSLTFSLVLLLVALVVFNQFMIPRAFASTRLSSGATVSLSAELEYGTKMTLKPMPLAAGEQPAIAGYKSKVKSLPTISELEQLPGSGDLTQDLINNIIPHGTPWYGEEAGVSFDDPVAAQQLWAKGEGIPLDGSKKERWNRIVNSFTCDYCCGSPQQPTIITRCGCAHAKAARGMAAWFIESYGDKFSDEEIYGEMARWYALYYPKGTIERILEELGV